MTRRRSTRPGILYMICFITAVLVLAGCSKEKPDFVISLLGQADIDDGAAVTSYYEELLGVETVELLRFEVGEFEEDNILNYDMLHLHGDLADSDSDVFIVGEDFARYLAEEGSYEDLSPYLGEIGISEEEGNILWWENEKGDMIAIAIRFGSNEIISRGFSGEVPGYVSLPENAQWKPETAMVTRDLVHN